MEKFHIEMTDLPDSSIHESLEEACAVHGLEVDAVLQSIKDYLAN